MLEKRYETQESENQAASGKLELERREVRQELIKKEMELDRTILALNESLQQNTELRNEIEQQQVMPLLCFYDISFYIGTIIGNI